VKAREKKIWLFGVFSACPLEYALKGCPFEEVRKKSALERWEHIEQLTEEEMDVLILHHKSCIYKREQLELKKCPPVDKLKKVV